LSPIVSYAIFDAKQISKYYHDFKYSNFLIHDLQLHDVLFAIDYPKDSTLWTSETFVIPAISEDSVCNLAFTTGLWHPVVDCFKIWHHILPVSNIHWIADIPQFKSLKHLFTYLSTHFGANIVCIDYFCTQEEQMKLLDVLGCMEHCSGFCSDALSCDIVNLYIIPWPQWIRLRCDFVNCYIILVWRWEDIYCPAVLTFQLFSEQKK
jgi:hypothetical protein